MEIINVETGQSFKNVAAIRFYERGFNLFGYLEVQSSPIPPKGIYLVPVFGHFHIDLLADSSLFDESDALITQHGWMRFAAVSLPSIQTGVE